MSVCDLGRLLLQCVEGGQVHGQGGDLQPVPLLLALLCHVKA